MWCILLWCCFVSHLSKTPSSRGQKGESRDDLMLSNELVWSHRSHWSRPVTASDSTVNSGIQVSRMAGDVCVLVITLSVFICIFRPPQPPWLRVFWQKSLTRWWITTTLKALNPSVCRTMSPQEPSAPDNRPRAPVHSNIYSIYIYIYIYIFIYQLYYTYTHAKAQAYIHTKTTINNHITYSTTCSSLAQRISLFWWNNLNYSIDDYCMFGHNGITWELIIIYCIFEICL